MMSFTNLTGGATLYHTAGFNSAMIVNTESTLLGMTGNTRVSPASTIYPGPSPAVSVTPGPTPVMPVTPGPIPAMSVNPGFTSASTMYTGPPPVMPVNTGPSAMSVNTGSFPNWASNTVPPSSIAVNPGFIPDSTMYSGPLPAMAINTGPPPVMPVNTGSIPIWTSNNVPSLSMPVNPGFLPVSAFYTGIPPFMPINTGSQVTVADTVCTTVSATNARPHPFSTANTGCAFSLLGTAMNISNLESRSTGTILHSLLPNNGISDTLDSINQHLQGIDLSELEKFQYWDLAQKTENFDDSWVEEGGLKIGEGGFGSVYQADISGTTVAVKLLKEPVDNQFFTELRILARCKHENLLRLLGFSDDGPNCCLVYEYMPNGSLEDRLACSGGSLPLDSSTRLNIAYFSAVGLDYLHNFSDPPLVHRDVKSANILLDENFVPKIGDFGLVRIGGSSSASTMAITKNCWGTEVYMAREARLGDVSVKLDTFSFGVILLELLTGLPAYDGNRKDKSLVTLMEDCENILTMLDQKVEWNEEQAKALYEIANKCLIYKKKPRPTIGEILPHLEKVSAFGNQTWKSTFSYHCSNGCNF